MSEVYNKWLGLGFLDGLDEETGIEVADSYEYLARILIGGHIKFENEETKNYIEACAFPILRKLICLENHIPIGFNKNIDLMLYRLNDFINFDLTLKTIKSFNGYSGVDIEAELCQLFIESYTKILSKELFLKIKKW